MNRKQPLQKILWTLLATTVAGLSLSASPVQAVQKTWSAGASGDWDTTSMNWNSGSATFNNTADTARFTNSATVTLTENINATGLLVNAGNLTVTINKTANETLTLNGGETNDLYSSNQGMNMTINPDLILAGAQSWGTGGGNGILTINGTITSSSNLSIGFNGSSTLRLMGNNSNFTGNLSTNNNLELGHNSALGTGTVTFTSNNFSIEGIGGARTFNNNLGMNTNNSNRTISFIGSNALEFTGNLPISVFGSPIRSFNTTNSADTTFSGVISGSNWTLEKTGAGRLLFDGNNTYSGPTNVNGGTLLINGTTSGQGNYTVAANATLGGTGTIGLSGGNSVTMQADSHLAPGMSVGTLAVSGNMILDSGAIYDWEYDAVDMDLVTVSGNLTLPSDLTVNLIELAGGELTSGVLFSAGSLSGATDLSGWTINGPEDWTLSALIQGTDVVLNAVGPVPEPSTAGLLLLGGVGLLMKRRRVRNGG